METIDKNQTIDETKQKLKASREQLEGELEVQLQDIKKDAAAFGKQVLLIGGGMYLSWRLVKALTRRKESKEDKRYKRIGKKLGVQQQKKKNNESLGHMIMHGIVATAFSVLSDQLKQSFKQENSVNDPKRRS